MGENPNFLLKPIGDLKDHHFFIPDYQRGYKWDVQQVLDLLEDIEEFEQVDDSFYCLQPLAVKHRTDEEFINKHYSNQENTDKIYEVIDGQQRLTTVHIILQILEEKGIYDIQYKTRKFSTPLLKDIKKHFGVPNVTYCDNSQKLKEIIDKKWQVQFNGKGSEVDNIDFYHFFTAYITALHWFEGKTDTFKETYSKKIKKQVQFVWYNETNEQNAKKVFRNLNSGKIALTNAELIKALFVNSLKVEQQEITYLKQTSFATEWDNIETTLQDDDFWYFISNTNANKYATRIDFLFELIYPKLKPKDNEDKIYTYRQYADLVKEHGQLKPEDWNVIKSLFLKLREWYEDNELYHLIGYLTASWNKLEPLVRIREIVKVSQGEEETGKIKQPKGKAAFKKYLIKSIRKKVFPNENDKTFFNLKGINYLKNAALLNRILLLHNIETYQKSVVGFRFPFYDFKYRKEGNKLKKNVWSLEHIHAQQADKVETVEELKEWLNGGDIQKLIAEIKETLSEEDYKRLIKDAAELIESYEAQKDTDKINDVQKELLNNIERYLKMHQIWNMALLEKDTNSSLGKKSFSAKREKIIAKVRDNKAFIPIGTRNVFLKVYTADLTQINYWNYQDRKDYLDDLNSKLAIYIQPKKSQNS